MPRRRGIIGKFPSLKMGCMIGFESLVERDYIYLLDFDPTITEFKEQPFAIRYYHEGKNRRYTPDFFFVRQDRKFIIECKPEIFVDDEENQIKWAAAQQWCAANNATFRVVTDADIRNGFHLENIMLLTDHARHQVSAAIKGMIISALMEAQQPLAVAQLMIAVCPDNPQSIITPILNMAYHQGLQIPLDAAPITVESLVYLPQKKLQRSVLADLSQVGINNLKVSGV